MWAPLKVELLAGFSLRVAMAVLCFYPREKSSGPGFFRSFLETGFLPSLFIQCESKAPRHPMPRFPTIPNNPS